MEYGNVIYIDKDGYQLARRFQTDNIDNVPLPFEGNSFEAIINLYYTIVALAKERKEGHLELCFIDLEEVEDLFKDYFLVLSKEEVEQKFDCMSKKIEQILYKAEIDEIRYWGPQTLGEVIFNYWD